MTSGTPFCNLTSLSPAYFCSYSSFTSLARIVLLKGAVRTEMMPENQGATVGMKESCHSGEALAPPAPEETWVESGEEGEAEGGRKRRRCVEASRSWMWSVSEYGRMAPDRSSGV